MPYMSREGDILLIPGLQMGKARFREAKQPPHIFTMKNLNPGCLTLKIHSDVWSMTAKQVSKGAAPWGLRTALGDLDSC